MKGNMFLFGIFFVGLILSIILFFNIEYISVYLGNPQKETLFLNNTNLSYSFDFDKIDITKCYVNNFNECYINLYIDEFKNNETLENIYYFELNDCYYKTNELTYEMSFIFDKTCINQQQQNIYINKTNNLFINKIEIEYIGFNRYTFSFSSVLNYLVFFFFYI